MIIGGKATKRSRYGFAIEEQMKGTIEATKVVSEAGLKIHVIDAEWRMNDVLPGELENLLGLFPDVRTFITIAARRRDVDQLLKLYFPIMEETGNAGLCIVAGNKVYLESDEASVSPYKSVKRVLEQAYGRISRILLGVEGLERHVNEIIKSYPDLKLFFLYDEEKLGLIEDYAKEGVESAVYVPYAVDKPLNDIAKMLADYALRRRWLKEELRNMGYNSPSTLSLKEIPPKVMEVLSKAVSRLSIYGTKREVEEKIRKLQKHRVSIVVGLPIYDVPDQVYAFSECLKSL